MTPAAARAILTKTNLASEARPAERLAWLVFEADYDRLRTQRSALIGALRRQERDGGTHIAIARLLEVLGELS